MHAIRANPKDAQALADLRAAAMKPSLQAINRYDEQRVRERFLSTFIAEDTIKLVLNDDLVGFYVVREKADHLYLDHLYIAPAYQNKQLGRWVLQRLKNDAKRRKLPIKLGALRGSKANQFYQQHGFVKTHEAEFDIYYQFSAR